MHFARKKGAQITRPAALRLRLGLRLDKQNTKAQRRWYRFTEIKIGHPEIENRFYSGKGDPNRSNKQKQRITMSTSHYSNGNYEGIKSSNPNPALISPSRTDEYPEPWADRRPRPSIQHSRPEAGDVGAETIRIPLRAERPKPPLKRAWLLMTGILLLVSDGCGLAYFCDSFWESLVFCCLTMPTCGFVLWCAWEVYSLNDNEDWTH